MPGPPARLRHQEGLRPPFWGTRGAGAGRGPLNWGHWEGMRLESQAGAGGDDAHRGVPLAVGALAGFGDLDLAWGSSSSAGSAVLPLVEDLLPLICFSASLCPLPQFWLNTAAEQVEPRGAYRREPCLASVLLSQALEWETGRKVGWRVAGDASAECSAAGTGPGPWLSPPSSWLGCAGRALMARGKQGARTPLRLPPFSSGAMLSSCSCPGQSRAQLHARGFPGSVPPGHGWAPCVQVVKEPLRAPQGRAEETASTNPRSFPELKAIKCFIDKPERGKYTGCIHSHTAWARPGLLLPSLRPGPAWFGGEPCAGGAAPWAAFPAGIWGVIWGKHSGFCPRAVPPALPGALQRLKKKSPPRSAPALLPSPSPPQIMPLIINRMRACSSWKAGAGTSLLNGAAQLG